MKNRTQSYLTEPLWLYVHFPKLISEAVLSVMNNAPVDKPVVVVNRQNNAQRVACYNEPAKQWGIEKALSLSTALAICPELVVLAKNPRQEQQLLKQLAVIAYSFSSDVIIDTEGLWLELSASEQLFNGYTPLLKRLHRQISSLSITATNGMGKSPLAAKVLCAEHFHTHLLNNSQIMDALEATSLEVLPSNKRQQQTFKQLGLITIGELIKLPRSALSQRFSPDLLETLELLLGEKPYSAPRFQPATEFYDDMQNPQGIYSKEGLIFPMEALLRRFHHYLIARQCQCAEIIWQFEPLLGASQSMTVNLSDSSQDCANLLDLSRLHLEQLDLPPSIERISLFCNQFITSSNPVFDLFDDLRAENCHSSKLIDCLHARLGKNAISQITKDAEHLPELASKITHIGSQPSTQSQHKLKETQQPIWLLPVPAPIRMYRRQLYWKKPLTIVRGPERICANWWQSEQQRDYYLASDHLGAHYWIYRESTDNTWFLHGVFA